MAHDENYIQSIAERIRTRIEPEKLPDKGLDQLFASYALLALSKGPHVSNEDVHDAWSTWATEFNPDSDALVPFDQLSPATQDEDSIFRDAINEVSQQLEGEES